MPFSLTNAPLRASCAAVLALSLSGCLLFSGNPNRRADDAQAKVDPGPYAGPLAEKYAGKVIFSSAPIPMDGTDDSAKYERYELGQPLFIRYWGADAPHNLLPCNQKNMGTMSSVNRRVELFADVNGTGETPTKDLIWFGDYEISEKRAKQRSMNSLSNELERAFTSQASVDGDGEEAGNATVRRFTTNVVSKLKDGKNSVRIVVALRCGLDKNYATMAEGSIDIDVPAGAKQAYLDKYGPKLAPSPHPDNDNIVRDIIAAMKKKPDWDNEVFIGAVVTSEDWQPIRNENTGVLVAYQIDAKLIVRAKAENDQDKCRVFNMSYRRDPAGGPVYFAGTGSSSPWPCSAAPATP